MDAVLRQRLLMLLTEAHSAHLSADAQQLWTRLSTFVDLELVPAEPDLPALELAAWAIQLPMSDNTARPRGRLGTVSLRERAESAAELLVLAVGGEVDDDLLDRTCRLLHETPHRPPVMDDAKLLADAVNLEDYGVAGLLGRNRQLARFGTGTAELLDACRRRIAYGYWEARLSDDFYFEHTRNLARRRTEHLCTFVAMLEVEML